MRASQIMTRNVVSVGPTTPILDAANLMLRRHVSGLPVLDENGALVGVVSQSDFLRRSEIGTQRRRPAWLRLLMGPTKLAEDFVHEHGGMVQDVMTRSPVTIQENTRLDELVHLMEKHGVHRLPVMRDKALVGIVTRSNVLQAVASMAGEVPGPTADDDQIRDGIMAAISEKPWTPEALQVSVRNGVVYLYGIIFDESARRASIVAAENVAGVSKVHDCMELVEATWNDGYRM
jgi:CBS-domain-containing membrane protein